MTDKNVYVSCGIRIRSLLFTLVVLFCTAGCKNTTEALSSKAETSENGYDIPINTLTVRDPFVLVHEETNSFYLHVNKRPHFQVYKSKDLKMWKDVGISFTPSDDFWGKEDFWAPDVFRYKNKYYLFATFSSASEKRGTSILVADQPAGPFRPLINRAVTPKDLMSLDGTLYTDENNKPWIIYCHEWLEVIDGEVVAQRLSEDLKETVGEPQVLFKASQAPWVGPITAESVTGYVTDAPFPYRAKNGELLMLWSSFNKAGKYAIGVARSESGNITGPWKQEAQPLNDDDGGHAMLFQAFGKLMISYHAPNSHPQRPVMYEVKENKGVLRIVK